MTNEALLTYAESQGCCVYSRQMTQKELVIHGKYDYIALNSRLSRVEEKEATAHALGHCMYGGFYDRQSKYYVREKSERRAEKWSYLKLLPIGEVRAAFAQGCCEIWEIAERFDVSTEFAAKAVDYYKTIGLI